MYLDKLAGRDGRWDMVGCSCSGVYQEWEGAGSGPIVGHAAVSET